MRGVCPARTGELDCASLEEHEGRKQPLSDPEWFALLHSVGVSDAVIDDDSREAIYTKLRGL